MPSTALRAVSWSEQVGLEELDAVREQRLQVLEPAARQVVDDAERGDPPSELLDQVGADERGASGDVGVGVFETHTSFLSSSSKVRVGSGGRARLAELFAM